jgi:hypothetical protein
MSQPGDLELPNISLEGDSFPLRSQDENHAFHKNG